MVAGKYDLTIEQGATLAQVFTWKDSAGVVINLTGYTARCHVRRRLEDTDKIMDLTTENGGITLGGVLGTITLNASATVTAQLSGNGVYDLEMISSGGQVTRLLQGKVSFNANVTR